MVGMSNATIFTIPFPPSVNHMFFNVPGKGRVKSNAYRVWRSAAGWDIKAAKPEKFNGPVEVLITLERKTMRGDIDNRIKAILDVLVDMDVLVDDKQVEKVSAEWGTISGARVEVRPYEIAASVLASTKAPKKQGARSRMCEAVTA